MNEYRWLCTIASIMISAAFMHAGMLLERRSHWFWLAAGVGVLLLHVLNVLAWYAEMRKPETDD